MGIKKIFSCAIIFLLLIGTSFAVRVVQSDDGSAPISGNAVNEGLKGAIVTFFTIGVMVMLFLGFLIIFAWILIKLWKKLSEYKRRKNDFIYSIFLDNINQCHINSDSLMKKRNWKLMWIFWKRKPVFTENEKGELDCIGYYHGEALKKEGFYMIGLYNKVGIFKYIGQIIIIPIEIKNSIVKKIDVEKGRTMIIRCEGLDQIENTDYYFIPLIKNNKKDTHFLDFSDKIHKDFIEATTHKDIIKENLQSYREGIIKSVETNPYVHFGRRGGKQFEK